MNRYALTVNGNHMGVWEAETPDEAIDAYFADAGYNSREAAAEVFGASVEGLLSEITIREVVSPNHSSTEGSK